LVEGKHPLINGLVGGLAHPLISLGYAFELDSAVVGSEALSLAAVCSNYLHDVVDKLKAPSNPSKTAFEVIEDIHKDNKFAKLSSPGIDNLESVVGNENPNLLNHFNDWNIDQDPNKAIEELNDLAVYIFAATHEKNNIHLDFFFLHLVTAMAAVRVLAKEFDKELMHGILLQYFYFLEALYVSMCRPEIKKSLLLDYDVKGKDWDYVIDKSLNSSNSKDAHFVKVIRALRDGEQAFGKKDGFYLKAAVKVVDNGSHWHY